MTAPAMIRRAARALTRHAAAMLPPSQAQWGQAMLAETEHIGSDAACLRWALGCLWASVQVRSGRARRLLALAARLGLAALIAAYALTRASVAVMTFAHKAGWEGAADRLAALFGAQDASAFAAVIDWVSAPMLAAMAAQCALYCAAAVLLAAGFRRAPHVFALAFAVHSVAWLAMATDATDAPLFTPAQWRQDAVVWMTMLAAGLLSLWLVRRRETHLGAAP